MCQFPGGECIDALAFAQFDGCPLDSTLCLLQKPSQRIDPGVRTDSEKTWCSSVKQPEDCYGFDAYNDPSELKYICVWNPHYKTCETIEEPEATSTDGNDPCAMKARNECYGDVESDSLSRQICAWFPFNPNLDSSEAKCAPMGVNQLNQDYPELEEVKEFAAAEEVPSLISGDTGKRRYKQKSSNSESSISPTAWPQCQCETVEKDSKPGDVMCMFLFDRNCANSYREEFANGCPENVSRTCVLTKEQATLSYCTCSNEKSAIETGQLQCQFSSGNHCDNVSRFPSGCPNGSTLCQIPTQPNQASTNIFSSNNVMLRPDTQQIDCAIATQPHDCYGFAIQDPSELTEICVWNPNLNVCSRIEQPEWKFEMYTYVQAQDECNSKRMDECHGSAPRGKAEMELVCAWLPKNPDAGYYDPSTCSPIPAEELPGHVQGRMFLGESPFCRYLTNEEACAQAAEYCWWVGSFNGYAGCVPTLSSIILTKTYHPGLQPPSSILNHRFGFVFFLFSIGVLAGAMTFLCLRRQKQINVYEKKLLTEQV